MKYAPPVLLLRSAYHLCVSLILFCLSIPCIYGQGPGLIYAKALNNSQAFGGSVQTRGVAVDASGNMYITGYFEFSADFDPGPGIANLNSVGSYNYNIFLAKYDASGNYIFAKVVSGSSVGQGLAIAVDGASNVYITGNFSGTADFDPGTPVVNLVSAGGSDFFIAKYNASGNYVYAKSIGGTSNDIGRSIVLDASSNVYITGEFSATADFDPGAGTANLTSAGSNDIFLAKYDASGNYVYAKGMGSTGIDIGYGIAIDASLNAYITGHFVLTVDFDPGVGTASLTSAGNNDIFLAKYDATGNYSYAKRIGSTGNDIGYGIAVDGLSNAYITGQFSLTVDFDPDAGTVNLVSAGSTDVFLAKYNASGTYAYANRMGGTSADVGLSIALDASRNAYIAGQFAGSGDFDPGAGTVTLTSAGSNDVFLGKYDASGIYTYAGRIGSTGNDIGYALRLDASSNIHITGQFAATVDFDPGAGAANLTAGSYENGFVVKLNSSATYLWAGVQGAYSEISFSDQGRSIAVDAAGNTYVTGQFQGTVDFDPGAGTVNLTSVGANDIFLAKYNASGNYVWAKRMGSASDDIGNGIVLDGSTVYITGTFNSTVDFNPGGTAANLVSAGNSDIFLAKYDASGNYVWARRIGGSSVDAGRGIAVDGTSNVYIIGDFAGTNVDFDPGAGTANLTSAGSTDIFFAKYSSAGIYVYAKRIGSTAADLGYAIAVDAPGNAYITGQFVFTVDFDPGAGTVNLTSAGGSDVYLAKYDASGNYLFAKRMGSTGTDIGYGLALDGSSNVHITGQFNGTVDFNSGGTAANLTSAGSGDIFFAKYSSSGVYIYAKGMGGTGDDAGFGIALDASSNVYITGQFLNTVDFDPGGGSATSIITANNSTDIFIAAYNTGAIIPLRFETVAARAVKSGEAVEVNWSTSSQIDNAYFEVQRSGNGVHFEPVSRVSGCLSCSEVRQYTAMDDHPFLGTSFYRIKQVDIDGKASYSKTVSVNLAKSTLNALHIYPTVTNNAFTVRVQNKGVEKKAMIQILSAEGKLVQEQTISLPQGENRISYSLAGEVSGIYYVRIVSDDQTSLFAKIIKQ